MLAIECRRDRIRKRLETRYLDVGVESLDEALSYLKIGETQRPAFFRSIETAIYTGTSMLNALINLDGLVNDVDSARNVVTRGDSLVAYTTAPTAPARCA